MCLAIPAEIIHINAQHAEVDILGIRQRINIQLVKDPKPGMYVLVHAGFAIQTIDKIYFNFLEETLKEMIGEEKE